MQQNIHNEDIQIEIGQRKGYEYDPDKIEMHQDKNEKIIQNIQLAQHYVPIPRKYIMVSITLLIAGLILFLVGISDYFSATGVDKDRDLSFIIIGGLLLIPGIYYTIKLVQAYLSKNNDERMEIISEFPLEAE